MAKFEDATNASKLARVDGALGAIRTTNKPPESLAWNSIGAPTGLLTAVAANGAIFSFRNAGANLMAVRRVNLSFVLTTAFTAAQLMEFDMIVARAFSVSDSAGTAIALTGNNGSHKTTLSTPTAVDCRVATTAALTAGTKTLDANSVNIVPFWAGAVGNGLINVPLFAHDDADYPLVLATSEGFNVRNVALMGAAGVGKAYINFEFAELLVADN